MSNRRRTYVLRVVYGLLLFFLAFLRFSEIMRNGSSRFTAMGHGSQMFESLVTLQFAGIYLFMPIIGCSAITQEKEQNTLPLLLLTRLGPTTILLEKLLSRLVPMFIFQLLAMPLLAFAYSLGGVDELRLWSTIVVLALTTVQVASITLLCSTYCRSTVSAFLSSYVFTAGSVFFLSCCGMAYITRGGGVSVTTVGELLIRSFLLCGSAAFFVLLARGYLLVRSDAAPTPELHESLQRYERIEIRPAPPPKSSDSDRERKMLYVWPGRTLPDYEPVAWREMARPSNRSLRTAVFAIQFVVGLLLLPAAIGLVAGEPMGFAYELVEVLLWIVAVLLIVVNTSGTVARERARQTLDVLLTTPLAGREIVTQQLRPAWKLVLLLWIPFGSLLLFRGLMWISDADGIGLLSAGMSMLVYLPLLVWITTWIGLRVRSPGRAIVMTLGLVTLWMMLPVFVPLPGHMPDSYRIEIVSWFTLSPLAMFLGHSINNVETAVSLTLFLAFLHGLLIAGIRHHVLSRADVWLGRPGEIDDIAAMPDVGSVLSTTEVQAS